MGTVSIVVPFDDRWYFAEILRGATERIASAGHRPSVSVIEPVVGSTRAAADAIERDFAAEDSLGAVITGFKYQADQTERALQWKRPLVVVGGSTSGFPAVMIDDIGAALTVTGHLIRLGHTRIVHLAGDLTDQMDFSVHGRRAKGYRAAMESAALEPRVVETDFDYDEAYRAAADLFASPTRPTAVFAVSDEIAFAALDAARDAGLRVGKDVSIAGIDDHPLAEQRDLTTVRQAPAEMGATAVDMLLSSLSHGPDPKQSRLHPVSLVNRGSTGRPV